MTAKSWCVISKAIEMSSSVADRGVRGRQTAVNLVLASRHGTIPMTKLTDEQRRVLKVLALHPPGCAEAIMLAQGFENALLGQLGIDWLAKTSSSRRLTS